MVARHRLFVPTLVSLLCVSFLGSGRLLAQGDDAEIEDFKFDVTTINGERISEKDFRDKVLLVDFWGTWCPPCRKAVPHLQALYKKYKSKGLEIVGLNYREGKGAAAEDKVRKFAEKNGLTYHLALGTDTIRDQIEGFRGYPTLLFFDRGLKFSHLEVGFQEGGEEAIEEWIQEALAKEAPEEEEADFKRLFLETVGGPKIEIGSTEHYELLILVHPKARLRKADLAKVKALKARYPKLMSFHILARADLPQVDGSLRVKKEDLAKIRLGKAFPAALLYNRAGAGNSRVTGLGGGGFTELLAELEKKLEADAAAEAKSAKDKGADGAKPKKDGGDEGKAQKADPAEPKKPKRAKL